MLQEPDSRTLEIYLPATAQLQEAFSADVAVQVGKAHVCELVPLLESEACCRGSMDSMAPCTVRAFWAELHTGSNRRIMSCRA